MSILIPSIPPQEIEARSMAIIASELTVPLDPQQAPIIMRVIHASADFSYAETLSFSEDALRSAYTALQTGAQIITDTNMALSGISTPALRYLNGEKRCFMADPDVACAARARGETRAVLAVEKALSLPEPKIFVFGNAPTGLIRLCQAIEAGTCHPALVVGAPVGFVHVLEAKDYLQSLPVPQIVAQGRKGGSNIAAAIINALLYQLAR